jgi:hypothetical protein
MISFLQKQLVFLLCVGLHTTLEWGINLKFDKVEFALAQNNVVDQFRSGIEDNSRLYYICL